MKRSSKKVIGYTPKSVSGGLKRKFNKYGAKKTTVFNIMFDSKKEARHFMKLKSREQANEIKDLKLQPRYDIHIGDKFIAYYKADFKYFDKKLKETIIVDVKGMRTPVYRLKKKLVEAIYNIKITEV